MICRAVECPRWFRFASYLGQRDEKPLDQTRLRAVEKEIALRARSGEKKGWRTKMDAKPFRAVAQVINSRELNKMPMSSRVLVDSSAR